MTTVETDNINEQSQDEHAVSQNAPSEQTLSSSPSSVSAEDTVFGFGAIVTHTSEFIDKNLQAVRAASLIGVGVSLAVICRSYRLFKTFEKVEEIPTWFVKKNLKLQGTVHSVDHSGVVYVNHRPTLDLGLGKIRSWLLGKNDPHPLPLEVAGVTLTNAAREWIEKNAIGREVTFRLLQISPDKRIASEILLPRKYSPFSRNLNYSLVRGGLAEYRPVDPGLLSNTSWLELSRRLSKAAHRGQSWSQRFRKHSLVQQLGSRLKRRV